MKMYFDIKLHDPLANFDYYLFEDQYGFPFCCESCEYDYRADDEEFVMTMFDRNPEAFKRLIKDFFIFGDAMTIELTRRYVAAYDLISKTEFYTDIKPDWVYFVSLDGSLRRETWSNYELYKLN